MFKKFLATATLAILAGLPFAPLPAQAQDNTNVPANGVGELQQNLGRFGAKTGFTDQTGESDLQGTVANIINVVLGFLGMIAVTMILTGGYKWMMAGGNEQEVSDAKNRIKNAVIGLVVVLLSYIIINYAVTQIRKATGRGGGGGTGEVTEPPAAP